MNQCCVFKFDLVYPRSSDIWIGLAETRTSDPCSLRWTQWCTVPDWTNFADESYTVSDHRRCTAVNGLGQFVKKECTDELQFVCAVHLGIVFTLCCSTFQTYVVMQFNTCRIYQEDK